MLSLRGGNDKWTSLVHFLAARQGSPIPAPRPGASGPGARQPEHRPEKAGRSLEKVLAERTNSVRL